MGLGRNVAMGRGATGREMRLMWTVLEEGPAHGALYSPRKKHQLLSQPLTHRYTHCRV